MAHPHRAPVSPDEIRSLKHALITEGLRHHAPPAGSAGLAVEIDRSWRRSIGAGAASQPDSIRFVNEFDADSRLIRAARPVLDHLDDMLKDLNTAVFLADRSGQIVSRRVPDRRAQARFDRACAAEGFDFSEERIGTNGLGTAMEAGAVFVRGPEHFNEALESLACAGAGIRHPITGRMMGSLSLAASADAGERTMLALARDAVRQILDGCTQELGRREALLGRCYREYRSKGPVIVLDGETVMTNVSGLSFLNAEGHARLWETLLAQDWSTGPRRLDLDLHTVQARVLARRLDDLGEVPAFVVRIEHQQVARTPQADAPRHLDDDPRTAQLRRVAGPGPSAVSVTGPSGAGKLHLALRWLRSTGHPEPRVFDASELSAHPRWREDARAELAVGGAVVVRRLEDLPGAQVNAVKDLRAAVGATARLGVVGGDARLLVTADPSRCSQVTLGLLAQFTVGAEVPALAHRTDELPALVATLLAAIDPGRRPILSAASVQVLLRWHWPGNVTELRCLVENLALRFPGQHVGPHHLPAHVAEAATRRSLTRMEAAERAEIVAALRQADGNRSRAASLLGIGRTTLYRKLRSLHIEEDALLPSCDASND